MIGEFLASSTDLDEAVLVYFVESSKMRNSNVHVDFSQNDFLKTVSNLVYYE